MGDAGFVKDWTDASEVHRLIESDHGNLGMKIDRLCVLLFRHPNRLLQKPGADPFPAIASQHSHAPNFCVAVTYDNSCSSACLASGKSQKMDRAFVIVIQLNLFRHALFLDEYARPDTVSFLQLFSRFNPSDPHGGFHGRKFGK